MGTHSGTWYTSVIQVGPNVNGLIFFAKIVNVLNLQCNRMSRNTTILELCKQSIQISLTNSFLNLNVKIVNNNNNLRKK